MMRKVIAPCCHDTIDLDPPDTEYLMVRQTMYIDVGGEAAAELGLREPYTREAFIEVPYHVVCMKAGRGLKEDVTYDMITVPGPLGTRRLTTRKELD